MPSILRLTTQVQHGGKIEIHDPRLSEGDVVDVIILNQAANSSRHLNAEASTDSLKYPATKAGTFLQTARGLNVNGPPDWSENIDHYLYFCE